MNSKEAKNAIWLIGGRVVQMILSFFISILTARYLGPGNYGIINYAGAYVAFFTSFCSLGINYVIIKDFMDNPNEQGKAIGTTLVLRLVSALVSSIMIVGVVSVIDKNEPLTLAVTALCSVALIFQTLDTINYWFQSRYQSKITSIATLIAYLVTSAYRIFLLVTGKSVDWFAFATSVDYICLGTMLYIVYKKNGGPKLSFSWEKGKNLLRKSYHYILSGMMVAIYAQTDKLMLKQMMDEVSVGYYSLALTVNLMWVFVLQAIIDSLFPTIMQLHKKDKEAFERKNRQLYAIVIYISIAVAFSFIVFGKYIITILYGDAYMASVQPLKIITWYTIFSYLGVARNAWVVCENKQKYLKYMYCTAAILNIVLNYIFIPLWGPSGAALASVITQIGTSMIIPCFIKDMRPNVKLMAQAFVLKGIK
ncbi:flippase [Clostridium polynesiense]|uniref:flippase n=1 Tax=Clostridium polynesiense TaxID=1325933 RepID=UPI00058BD8D9|nr:flippase [Clostridium polynesiense]